MRQFGLEIVQTQTWKIISRYHIDKPHENVGRVTEPNP